MKPIDRFATSRFARRSGVLLLGAVVFAAGCRHRPAPNLTAPALFSAEVREMLSAGVASSEYYEARMRLEEMGPMLDGILVGLAREPQAKAEVRANALIMLADRGSPSALAALRRSLRSDKSELVRTAAVLGLQRLLQGPDGESAARLLRSAVADPSRNVRINALQGLDIRDVSVMRRLLETEQDPEVRRVATQLISLAENRGAPLAADRRGALRTVGVETEPQIVFLPIQTDSFADYASGDLRIVLPEGPDIPLGVAEVVAGVVPAFFSPDRSAVVYEVEREIRVLDLETRRWRTVGPGVAPRPLPFSHQFVFVREVEGGRRELGDATELVYTVYRSSFATSQAEPIGEMHAVVRMESRGNYSPVRWMVVGETPEGFVLRGEGITTFTLPTPVWQPAPGDLPVPRAEPRSRR